MASPQNRDAGNQSGKWAVFRMDDHGNVFLVRPDLSEDFARSVAKEFQDRGHKQIYWAEIPEPGRMPVTPSRDM